MKKTVDTQWHIQYNLLTMEVGPQAAVPRHTHTNAHTHTHNKTSACFTYRKTDKKTPFRKQQTVSGKFTCLSPYTAKERFKSPMWLNSYLLPLFFIRNRCTRQNSREFLRFLVFPEKYEYLEDTVCWKKELNLNSLVVSQTLRPSTH